MHRSLQEYPQFTINGNDRKHTECSENVKLFLLAYKSQIITTFGISPYENVY